MVGSSLRASFFAALCSSCFYWSHIDSLDEVAGAAQVRVEPAGAPAYVLQHPATDEVREAAVREHAQIAVKRVNGWGTAAIITGGALATAATILPLVVLSLVHVPVYAQRAP